VSAPGVVDNLGRVSLGDGAVNIPVPIAVQP
jgi:hypothetical protein